MYLLDTNVALAAYREDHPHHLRVRPWLDDVLATGEPFGVPDSVWVSFVRLATHRKIFTVPSRPEEAFEFIRSVRHQPGYVPTNPGPDHIDLFEQMCRQGDAAGDLVVDASLAAIAQELGCVVASFDRDFGRFPGLGWVVPGG
ncbi:MAG TPA: type II toxin-antitoxin system VapC family toxin [Acidimicrobiales bacterium]|nr:type II toxin-antitoxin system VapC family toxin [Acidimicrobiales bacterium]